MDKNGLFLRHCMCVSEESLIVCTMCQVFIYNHSTIYADTDAFDVAVHTDTNIRMSKSFLHKLGEPYSSCVHSLDDASNAFQRTFSEHNLTYRHSDCLNLCYQLLLRERCACVDCKRHFYDLLDLEVC